MRHEPSRTAELYRSDLERHLFVLEATGGGISTLSARLVRWVRAAAALMVW